MSRTKIRFNASPMTVTVLSGVICAVFVLAVGSVASARLSSKHAAALEAEARALNEPATKAVRRSPTHQVPVGKDEQGVITVSA